MTTRLLFLLFAMLCISASAQEFRRADVFAGYSYANIDTNGLTSRQSLNGWEVSASVNANKWLAGEADVGGYYKNYNIAGIGVGIHDYAFLAGPRLNYRPVFVHALFGLDRLTGSVFGLSASQNSFAAAAGGGLQVKIAPQWSARISADYVHTQHNIFGGAGVTQNSVRASVGVVYSFGGTSMATSSSPAAPRISRTAMQISALGVSVATRDGRGAEVIEVVSGSIAEMAGLQRGDVINAVDIKPVRTPMELAVELSNRNPGAQVKLGFMVRGYWQSETTIILRN